MNDFQISSVCCRCIRRPHIIIFTVTVVLFITVLKYWQNNACFYFSTFFCRGVARIFQRGGHRGYSPDHHPGIAAYIWFIPLLSLVYQWAQSYYRGMKALNYKKTNLKKVGFSTMAFTAKILSWRFRHLNIVGCLLKRRPTKGGSRAPQDPPPPP